MRVQNFNMIDKGLFHIMPPHVLPSTFLSASTVECSVVGNKKAIVATKIYVGRKQNKTLLKLTGWHSPIHQMRLNMHLKLQNVMHSYALSTNQCKTFILNMISQKHSNNRLS